MKTKSVQKLKLAAETIRHLEDATLAQIAAGRISALGTCPCQQSMSCISCTTC